MPIILQYLLAIGSFQGLLLFALLSFGAQNNIASRILGAWYFFLALGFLGPFITLKHEVNMFSGLIGWSLFLPASYGGFLYLYCKHSITNQSLKLTDVWHLTPLLLCYLLNIDMLMAPPEVKLQLATSAPPDSISFFLSRLITYSQAFIYLGFTFNLVRKYQVTAKNTLSNFNPDIFNWLWRLLSLTFLIWSLKLISHFSANLIVLAIVGDLLIIVMIYSVALAQWRNPRLFKIEQLDSEFAEKSPTSPDKTKSVENALSKDTINSGKGALTASTRQSILDTVKIYMDEQQAFKNEQLTLANLSQAIGVSSHHLSEALNQLEGKNFYQFVNEYRINSICEMLQTDHSSKIIELALVGGFSSKSTFNTVFKQIVGVTPTQYRKKVSN